MDILLKNSIYEKRQKRVLPFNNFTVVRIALRYIFTLFV
jgi:hypothetical protein